MNSPTQIDRFSDTEMLLSWNSGERYSVSYVELRFQCPCAACVDENTGRRTIERSSINSDVRPQKVSVVGRYAIQIQWSDRHSTGVYHFDRLYEVCRNFGLKLALKSVEGI